MSDGAKKMGLMVLSDVSGGINSIENPVSIGNTQVQPTTVGCILKRSGFIKYPGAVGLSTTTTFADYMRMLTLYRAYDTTETMVALSSGKLYFVNQTTGALTEKYTLGSDANQGSSCEAYNKLFVCNGTTKVVKVEGTAVYPVGIAAPTGVTAAASAGAGLPDGAYDVIVGYGRRISGVDVLYSQGQTIGAVTLGGGNNRITIANFANSTDAQVGTKVLWLKSPSETIHYYFYGTNDNTTTTFIVSGTGAKNVSNIYETYAIDNGLPPAGTYIYSFANRLWMIKDDVIYYSSKGYSQYDIEKFGAANFIVTPYKLTGIFSVGYNLYFNTESGILGMVNADPSSALYLIEPRWHFVEMNTVARWNNGVIGLTNDGVRMFDGTSFTDYDMSYTIKNYINDAIKKKANFPACGYVYRRGIRNEYHLMWQDESISTSNNNMHAILNLDTVMYASADQYNFGWEFQPYSASYATVSRNTNLAYCGQTHATEPKVYYETPTDDMLNYLYKPDGTLIAIAEPYQMVMQYRVILPAVEAVCWFNKFRVLLSNNAACAIEFKLPDQSQDGGGNTLPLAIPAPYGGAARYDISKYDSSYYPIEQAFVFVGKLQDSFKGREITVKISQTDNDPSFELMKVQLQYRYEVGNFL